MPAPTSHPIPERGCANCIMRGLGLCRVLIDMGLEQPLSSRQHDIAQEKKSFATRRLTFRQDDVLDGVPVICEGWASCMVQLASGRRQILSFLLPGEAVTVGLLVEQELHFSVEPLTPGRYRIFDRAQLKAAMTAAPQILDRMLSACSAEKRNAERLITDLGRRTAAERVARLILDIWDRLDKAGMVQDTIIDFPLRQNHIADATGLTPVYVNKVLGEFRRSGLVTITGRSLLMTDVTRLRRLAG